MNWKDESFLEFKEKDILKGGSNQTYFKGGIVATENRLREYLRKELEHHQSMLEMDKKEGLKTEITFRMGIISEIKAIFHIVASDSL